MAGVSKHQAGCTCCNCPQTINVSVRCRNAANTTATAVANAAVTVLDANSATLDAGLTDTKGNFAAEILGSAGNYTVNVTRSGYPNATQTVNLATCNASVSTTFYLCPTQANVQVNVSTCFSVPVANALVTISGDSSGNGTTATNGRVTIPLAVPANACNMALNVAVAPLSGTGMANTNGTMSLSNLCTTGVSFLAVEAANGYVPVFCNATRDRHLRDTLYFSGGGNAATLTYNAAVYPPRYEGAFTFSSDRRLQSSCTPAKVTQTTGDVQVQVWVPVLSCQTFGLGTMSYRVGVSGGYTNCADSGIQPIVGYLETPTTTLAGSRPELFGFGAGAGPDNYITGVAIDCNSSLTANGTINLYGRVTCVPANSSPLCTLSLSYPFTITETAPPGGDSTWPFDADAEGWSSTTSAGTTTGGWVNTDGSPDAGCYQVGSTGFNTHVDHAEWAGTFEDLGVPPGTTVTGITLTSIKSKAVSVDSFGSIGLCQFYLLNSGGSTLATLLASRLATANETTWTESNGTEQTISQASNTSIRLQLVTTLDSGLSSAAMTARYDSIDIALEYA
jgi:hypothetical protein